jgi:hypothetical protein
MQPLMSARIVKTFAWLWIATLLTATVGLSMHRIYCYCVGQEKVSLFSHTDACTLQERANIEDCCRTPAAGEKTSCCSKDTGAPEQKGCMDKSTRFFQLKTEFVVDKPFEKHFDCPLWIEKMPVFRRFLRPAFCAMVPPADKAPPPSPSGRELLVRLRTFRC